MKMRKYTTQELLTGKKLYFVDIKGNLLEYDEVCKSKALSNSIAPQEGCDILIYRCGISSGNSKCYKETKKEALEDFIRKQTDYIKTCREQLEGEVAILSHAIEQLR